MNDPRISETPLASAACLVALCLTGSGVASAQAPSGPSPLRACLDGALSSMAPTMDDDAAIDAFRRRCATAIDGAADQYAATRCIPPGQSSRSPDLERQGCFHAARYAIYKAMLGRLRGSGSATE